jgi:hypothetical protein
VNSNPVRYNDPTGHFAWVLAGAAIGAVVGLALATVPQMIQNAQSGQSLTAGINGGEVVKAVITGALIGAGAVLLAPVVVAAASDALAGAAVLSGSTALMEASIAVGGTAAVLTEAATGVAATQSEELPVLGIDSGKMPNISNNIKNAQANGAPSVLTRTTNQALINSNRSAATSGFTGIGSPDEYPFASTYEGGSGAFVSGVPLTEQRIQGGVLSSFYQNNNIGDGDCFVVCVY